MAYKNTPTGHTPIKPLITVKEARKLLSKEFHKDFTDEQLEAFIYRLEDIAKGYIDSMVQRK